MVNNTGINRVLNIIITLLVVAVITLSTVFFIRFSRQNRSATPASVSKVERHSSAKESSQSTDEGNGAVAASSSPTPPNDQQVSGVQPDVAQRANGVIVDNGMNFNYRAAQALGIIPNEDTESSVMDFYANCQDYDNGFIYNGQKYNTQVIQDGHENEYHCNILVTPAN